MNRKTKKELIISAGLFVVLIIVIHYQLVEIKKTLYPVPDIYEDIFTNQDTYPIDSVYAIPDKPYVYESYVADKSTKILKDKYYAIYRTLSEEERELIPRYDSGLTYPEMIDKIKPRTELALFTIPYKGKVVKQFLYKVTIGLDELYFDPKTGKLRAWYFFKAGFKKKLPV